MRKSVWNHDEIDLLLAKSLFNNFRFSKIIVYLKDFLSELFTGLVKTKIIYFRNDDFSNNFRKSCTNTENNRKSCYPCSLWKSSKVVYILLPLHSLDICAILIQVCHAKIALSLRKSIWCSKLHEFYEIRKINNIFDV